MSFGKLLDIKDHFLRNAANENYINDLKHEIEEKLNDLDGTKGPRYGKQDVIQFIILIEKSKLRFLQGEISVKQLYCVVAAELDRFKTEHPGFNFLNDSVVNAYYSSGDQQ
jgi:hypothetical protein